MVFTSVQRFLCAYSLIVPIGLLFHGRFENELQ